MGFYIALCFGGSPHACPLLWVLTWPLSPCSPCQPTVPMFPLILIKECCSKWNLGRRRQERG